MPPADFVHLRVHTAYARAEGAIRIDELVGVVQTFLGGEAEDAS